MVANFPLLLLLLLLLLLFIAGLVCRCVGG
jgi:hypothetical protein